MKQSLLTFLNEPQVTIWRDSQLGSPISRGKKRKLAQFDEPLPDDLVARFCKDKQQWELVSRPERRLRLKLRRV